MKYSIGLSYTFTPLHLSESYSYLLNFTQNSYDEFIKYYTVGGKNY